MATQTRLVDVPRTIGWGTVALIQRNLSTDSQLFRAQNPEVWAFSTAPMQSKLMADLIDLLAWLRYEHAMVHSEKHKPNKPEPYPTPWNKGIRPGNQQNIGKGVRMTVEEFNAFYYGSSADENN